VTSSAPTTPLDPLEASYASPSAPGAPVGPPPVSRQLSVQVQRFGVLLEDGTQLEVTVDARDTRAYVVNRQRDQLPAIRLDDPLDALMLYTYAAWHAAHVRTGATPLTWAQWADQVIALELVSIGRVDPTSPGPGAG